MKKKYIAPKVQVFSVEKSAPILAASGVSVSNSEGSFDSDDYGHLVVNSRPSFSLWNEEE